MKKIIILMVFGFTLLIAKESVKFIKVVDGDSVIFMDSKKRYIFCKLDGVDAPEISSSAKLIHDTKRAFTTYSNMIKLGQKSKMYLKNTFIKNKYYKIKYKSISNQKEKKCLVYLPNQVQTLNERIS